MWFARSIGLVVCAVLWRMLRAPVFGRPIIKALGSGDENLRTIAGMLLVRAGRVAEPQLEEALRRRENLPIVLTILADIGDKHVEPQIRDFSKHKDPEIAEAAKQALRVLAAQR